MVDPGHLIAGLRDNEVQLLVERTSYEAQIAKQKAESDLDILYAMKAIEVAKSELNRAMETNAKYAKTVSESELDRLRLLVEQGELEIKKARRDHAIANLTYLIRENEHRSALDQLERRKVRSPMKGMIVELHHAPGEAVQAGDALARIIRLDRLRAEGFLPASSATPAWNHARAKLTVTTSTIADTESAISKSNSPKPSEPNNQQLDTTPNQPQAESVQLEGHVVFISPEVDPVNNQVRVWVEFDNPDLLVRPGMSARVILERP